MKCSSISAFIPCFNEVKNLPLMVEQLLKVLPKCARAFEIIIVDDGSTDGTSALADDLAKRHKELRVVHHPTNLGYGASLRSGFNMAKYDWIFYTDGDQQFDVNQLKDFIPHTTSFGVIIGFREKRAEGFRRSLNANLFKAYIDVLFRLHVRDIDCAFKLIKTELIKPLHLTSTGAFTTAEFLYLLKKQKIAFKQQPVKHYLRKHGVPTGNSMKVVLKAGWEALRLYLQLKIAQIQR